MRVLAVLALLALTATQTPAQDAALRPQAEAALKKAVAFFSNQVSVEGGYLWRYSDDLAKREGEGKAPATRVWVQPPGTPAVGMAFLAAHQATGDREYLEAARKSAYALLKGQLRSGGWYYHIDFDPFGRKAMAYRDGGNPNRRNTTTLDDDNTQSALRFLMRADQALGFKDEKIHEGAQYALTSLLKAQFPNGAWFQAFAEVPDFAKYPVKQASFPETWSRSYPGGDYWYQYTFNDNLVADMIDTMLLAGEIYSEPKYRESALKAGSFIRLAQLPEPQPAWAQQYNANTQPSWARKFEPPAVTGGESQRLLRTLMLLYRETGDTKHLEPIPKALDWMKRSRLADGRLARFYELKTNKPLYFTRDYKLVYTDDDLPTHYSFKIADHSDEIAKELERVKALAPADLKPKPDKPRISDSLVEQTRKVIAALDNQGRWVEDGSLRSDPSVKRVIQCQTFIRNVEILSSYLAATR